MKISSSCEIESNQINCKDPKKRVDFFVRGAPVSFEALSVDNEGKGHPPTHKMGLFFTQVENELEYLVYVLFGVDVSLLCIISGFIWKNRFEIMRNGVNRVLV